MPSFYLTDTKLRLRTGGMKDKKMRVYIYTYIRIYLYYYVCCYISVIFVRCIRYVYSMLLPQCCSAPSYYSCCCSISPILCGCCRVLLVLYRQYCRFCWFQCPRPYISLRWLCGLAACLYAHIPWVLVFGQRVVFLLCCGS